MADGALAHQGEATAAGVWQRPALRIAILYVAARVVTTLFFLGASALSGPASRFGLHAAFGTLVMGWDAQWYWFTAENGYPSTLPLTPDGKVMENQWAFLPLYPYLAKLLGIPLGGWPVAAVVVSLVAGYLTALVLYRMLTMKLDATAATWAVVFFASGPLAALFQVGYAEALFMLWLLLALWLVMRRRYGWLYLLIPLMGFTRPGVLAFALFLGLFGIWRWFARRREPLPAREIVHIVALAAVATVVGFAWQVIAGIATGDASAYLRTELAWRRNWIPDAASNFLPFDGFIVGTRFWSAIWGWSGLTGFVVLAASVLAIAALLIFEPHVRRLGVEIRLWSASYLLYLLAVFFPQSSIFRLLLPLSPLWGAVAAPRSTGWRVAVLVACIAGQWWWIYNMYALANTYWQIP
jgi:hypothetical protein